MPNHNMKEHLTYETAEALIAKIFAADESLNAEAFVNLLSPAAIFQLGGSPAINGLKDIQGFVQGLFSSLKSIRHRLVQFWLGDGKLVFQGEVTFTFPNEQSLMLPYVDVLTQGESGLIDDYRIYIDLTPMNAGTR